MGMIIFSDFEFSVFKSPDKQPETIAFIIEDLDTVSCSVGKDKETVIKDIHFEMTVDYQCQPINRFSHINIMAGNIDVFDFISIDDHFKAPIILSRSCGLN